MNNIALLVKGELYKISKYKKMWFFFIFIIGVISISGVISKTELHTGDWKVDIEKRLQDNYTLLSQLESDETNNKYKKQIDNYIMLDEYSINKNIPPVEDYSAIGFVKKNIAVTWIINAIMIIYASSIISNEYAWGTIKFLVVRPYKRSKILISKFLTIIILNLFFYVILMIYSFFVGLMIHGFEFNHFITLNLKNGQVVEQNIYYVIMKLYLYNFIPNISYVSLAIMVSTLLKSSGVAAAISIAISTLGGVLAASISMYPFAKYVLFVNTDLVKYIQGTAPIQGGAEWFSITIILFYSTLFFIPSIYIFNKRSM
ncbi:ABC transporter permease [Paenibacillus sp. MER TA 81-3]|uniref:ABC transporter permease n=1 Tax=Paenibacillus sp. MER TA 81-3 TaxID=2939573 RepID=UPI002040E9D7|nr:ABC transporter permease subunit [Paenibacillus sp. MER TA 81-3]MCM3338327.1 ABC transporter permease [Paenibacillus sp. MER TA 81-3]